MKENMISYAKRKLKFNTRQKVYDHLGITAATGIKYSRNKSMSNSEIWCILSGSRKSAIKSSVQPITEYYPVTVTPLRHNDDFINSKNNQNHKRLRQELDNNIGIYVFYDSSGRAIYVGKAERSLYQEMRSTFNRHRNENNDVMTIVRARHTTNNMKDVKFRKCISRHRVYLSEICSYFSAYKVDEHLIPMMEAIMIRAFANNLTNFKIQSL